VYSFIINRQKKRPNIGPQELFTPTREVNKMASIKKIKVHGYTPQIFMDQLAAGKTGYDQLAAYERRAIANYTWRVGMNNHPHSLRQDETSIPYQDFWATLGRGRLQELNDRYRFFDISSENYKDNTTRGFILPPDMQKIFSKFAESLEEPSTELLRIKDGKLLLTVPKAIESRDMLGNTRKGFKGASPFEKVEIDYEKLQEHLRIFLYQRNEHYMANFPDPSYIAQLDYLCTHIGGLIRACETVVAGRGMKMERYRESRGGRIYALRGYSLQGIQREIRNTALNGYWDIDLQNCHYAIFIQMAAECGYTCIAIKDYIGDTRGTRERLSDDIGITYKQVKEALLMSLYGAAATLNPERSLPKLIGDERRLKLLYTHTFYRAIRKDLMGGRKAILEAKRGMRGYTNILGKLISPNEDPKSILGHLMQGVEAKALDSMMTVNPLSTAVAIHHGFVSPCELNITSLENAITKDTGYTFTVTMKRLEVTEIDDYFDF